MKKFILLQLSLLLLAMGSCSMPTSEKEQPTEPVQEATGHLTFKGVPIDGSLQEYVEKMKDAGFTVGRNIDSLGDTIGYAIDTIGGVASLQGDFAGYKDCTVEVATVKPHDIVSTINVLFPERDEWSALESDYENLKSMLMQKYGEPAECKEKFTDDYGLDNWMKLSRLKDDECTWYTTFSTTNGDIKLSLEHRKYNCFVQLSYFDRLNSNAVRQQAINDL